MCNKINVGIMYVITCQFLKKTTPGGHGSNHGILPRHSSYWIVVVVHEVLALSLGSFGDTVASYARKSLVHVLQPATLLPCPGDDIVVFIFFVQDSILETGVPVVKAEAGLHDAIHSIWVLLQGCQQTAETVCQDAKSVLHYAACTGQSVVKDNNNNNKTFLYSAFQDRRSSQCA